MQSAAAGFAGPLNPSATLARDLVEQARKSQARHEGVPSAARREPDATLKESALALGEPSTTGKEPRLALAGATLRRKRAALGWKRPGVGTRRAKCRWKRVGFGIGRVAGGSFCRLSTIGLRFTYCCEKVNLAPILRPSGTSQGIVPVQRCPSNPGQLRGN